MGPNPKASPNASWKPSTNALRSASYASERRLALEESEEGMILAGGNTGASTTTRSANEVVMPSSSTSCTGYVPAASAG